MSRDMGRFLGEMIGTVVEIDPGSNGNCLGKFVRVRVLVDVSKPLKRILRVDVGDPDDVCIVMVEEAWSSVDNRNAVLGVKNSSAAVAAVLAVLNDKAAMGEMSRAVMVLVPKIKTPVRACEFRPISLYNVTYKLVAKVLANRLKDILEEIISPNQSAFVPGRLISDNVVVGFECLHALKNRKKGKVGWNINLVRSSFLEEDAEAILQLPLSIFPRQDSVLWHYDRYGNFSVKSAYKLAFQNNFSDLPSCSYGSHFIWKFIWNLPIPSKLKIFCWRICCNILPTKDLLCMRHIVASNFCELCGKGPETVDHAIWGCCKGLREEDLWLKADYFMKDFSQAFSLPSISRPPLSITVCWNPPPKGCLKLNVDATINKYAGKIGLGVVVRDYTGSLVFAAGIVAPLVVDVACAKGKALLAVGCYCGPAWCGGLGRLIVW
ncbi:hypothetical protein ACOSQ2_017722 [Xanthoceras sorbifolium]